jgi:hypothetical protein
MRSKLFAFVVLFALAGASLPAHAGTGSVRVVFAKAGLIAGIGGGSGVLTFHGKRYPFDVSGFSLGATAGISTTQFVGTVLNLNRVEDFAGPYTVTGGGAAVVAGAGRVRLVNAKDVVLLLGGAKFGIELSANFGNVTITMK